MIIEFKYDIESVNGKYIEVKSDIDLQRQRDVHIKYMASRRKNVLK